MTAANATSHPKARVAIRVMVERSARPEVRQQIRARGKKLLDYRSADIARMARELMASRGSEFVARAEASAVVRDIQKECERKEQRRLERKPKQKLNSKAPVPQAVLLNETHAHNDGAM
jgi:hypothetical protein